MLFNLLLDILVCSKQFWEGYSLALRGKFLESIVTWLQNKKKTNFFDLCGKSVLNKYVNSR